MKTLMRGAAIGLALALGAQVAQAQAGLSLGLGAGAVIPTGDMGEVHSTGWTGQASLRLKPAVSPVGFQVDASYNRLGIDSDLVEGNTSAFATTANAVFAFPSAAVARPYLIGGLGMYNMKATVDDVSGSDTKFGANAGAGFDLKLGSASLYAEGRFHAIFSGAFDAESLEETTAYMVPLTVGLRWSLR
jgi:Outer membrane protein beta-barrel domain